MNTAISSYAMRLAGSFPSPFLASLLLFCAANLPPPASGAVSDDPSTTHSLDAPNTSSEFIVTSWKSGDGLPVNEVRDLAQTPDGYLWMGTHRGLVRFDGSRFQSFLTTPTGSRYGTLVTPLEMDPDGHLWTAPDEIGIMRLQGGTFSELLTNAGFLQARVVSLCAGAPGWMYWVDASGRLGRVSTAAPFEAERIRGGGANAESRWLRDFKGHLWLLNLHGLKAYDHGKWREVRLPGNASMVATPRRAGGLWVAREARLRYVPRTGKSHEVATFPWKGESRVTCLLEDHSQRLWIGTEGEGLFCFSDGVLRQIFPTASGILCLFEDSQNNLWAGTRGKGILRVRPRQFFVLDHGAGLKSEFVRSIAQDTSGRLWIACSEGGLGWWSGNQWHPAGEAEGWVKGLDGLSIFPKADGSVWVSTGRHGFWRWTGQKFIREAVSPGEPREACVDMQEDAQHRLWMVTDNSGVFCLDQGKLKSFGEQQGLPSNLVRRLVLDPAGRLWAGDWEGGIARFENDRWILEREPSGHGDAVRCMTAEKDTLWIGTSAGGLLRFRNGQTARISEAQGLPDVCIQQVLMDGRGSLWGGTPHSLFRIPMDQLNAVADGRRQKVEPVVYGRGDGLPDISFGSWFDPRCWRARDGELWFATANGAIHFNPANLREGPLPQVILEQTLVDGKPVTRDGLQRLRPGPERIEFRFSAPCLTAPERIRFRYQMSGVDPIWVEAGRDHSAIYASIPSGKHTFRVLASSPEGVWDSEPASIELAVHPYFWQTSWFWAAVAALLAGGAVWIIRRATVRRLNLRLERLRQQQAVERERTRIAQDIHDELGANLTSIGLMADMGIRHRSDPEALTRELGQISATARESVAAMDAIVWTLNPRNDSLDHFANYVAQFTRDFFRPTRLRTRLDLPANLPAHPMTTDTRHQLFLIVKESFNNVVRHAEATEVNLQMACENGHLRLSIADNGQGIPGPTGGEGRDGLVNLEHRIKQLGGTLRIVTAKGEGVRLDFILPLAMLSSN